MADLGKMLYAITPDGALYFNATADGEGNITSVDKIPLDDVNDVNEVLSNLVVNSILSLCYGIDIAGLAKDYFDLDTDYRIIGLSTFIKNCDWKNATIKDNSTTPPTTMAVSKYIKKKFKINKVNNFIDKMYENVRNCVYGAQYNDTKKYYHIEIDAITNWMINVVAVVIGSNPTFMEVPIGQDTIINVPFDKSHLDDIEDFLHDYLVENGYINNTYVPTLAFPQQLYDIFTNTPLDSDDYFKYIHIQIVKEKTSGNWQLFGYITHEEITHLATQTVYGNRQPSWGQIGLFTVSIPYTADGAINYTNLCGFYSTSNGWTEYCYNSNSRVNLFQQANSVGRNSIYTVWCRRTDFTDPTTETYYSDLSYDGDGTNGHCSTNWGGQKTPVGLYPYYAPITQYNESRNGIAWWWTRYGGENGTWTINGDSGSDWGLSGIPQVPYDDEHLVENIDVIKNNQNITRADRLSQPTIDSTTAQNLEDNNVELVCTGEENLHIFLALESVIGSLQSTEHPFDTSYPLKVGTCDPILNVLLNNPATLITSYKQANATEWSGLFNKEQQLDLQYLKPPVDIGMGLAYHLTDELLSLVTEDMWNKDIFQTISYFGRDFYDTILFLRQLPYTFIPAQDYWTKSQSYQAGQDTFFYDDNTVPIKYGCDVTLPDQWLGKLKGKGHAICAPVHEIYFTLTPETPFIEHHNNFTDYYPYVKAMIYLPFIGTMEIQPEFIMREHLIVKYRISNITGDFLAMVCAFDNEITEEITNGRLPLEDEVYRQGAPILYVSGNCALERVISGKNADLRGVLSGITQTITSCMGSYSSVGSIINTGGNSHINSTNKFNNTNSYNATGTSDANVYSSNIGTNKNDISSKFNSDMTRDIVSKNSNVSFGGVASGIINTGISLLAGQPVNHNVFQGNDVKYLGLRTPYIMISYNPPIDDMNPGTIYDKTIGHATSHGQQIKEMSGDYHEISSVKLEGILCTNEERHMIEQILKGGFYNGLNAGESLRHGW